MDNLKKEYEQYLALKVQFEKDNAVFQDRQENLINKLVEEVSDLEGFSLDPEKLKDSSYVEGKCSELEQLLIQYKQEVGEELSKTNS